MHKQLVRCFLLVLVLMLTACSQEKSSKSGERGMYIDLLKEMFQKMVLNKNASLIPQYYHRDFLLYTNGQEMDFITFLESHQKYYQTPIQYQIKYDEGTFLEQGARVAGRVWITTKMPEESSREIEVMLIAEYKEGKLYRLWELTYPDWSQLPAFNP